MAVVISDSSILIHLTAMAKLSLLKEFYGIVTIPAAVQREVVEEGRGRPGSVEVMKAIKEGWIVVRTPTDQALLRLLKRNLDEGEAEAIALAVETQAELVLLDESDARRVADVFGVKKTGVIGLLIRAKQEGQIPSLREELNRLRKEAGFWISDTLYQQALEAVKEETTNN